MNLLTTYALELTSNIPMWLGFMVAAWIFHQSSRRWWLSILVLFLSALLSAVLILLFEPIKRGGSAFGMISIVHGVGMALVFTIVALPCLWYFTTSLRWV